MVRESILLGSQFATLLLLFNTILLVLLLDLLMRLFLNRIEFREVSSTVIVGMTLVHFVQGRRRSLPREAGREGVEYDDEDEDEDEDDGSDEEELVLELTLDPLPEV